MSAQLSKGEMWPGMPKVGWSESGKQANHILALLSTEYENDMVDFINPRGDIRKKPLHIVKYNTFIKSQQRRHDDGVLPRRVKIVDTRSKLPTFYTCFI